MNLNGEVIFDLHPQPVHPDISRVDHRYHDWSAGHIGTVLVESIPDLSLAIYISTVAFEGDIRASEKPCSGLILKDNWESIGAPIRNISRELKDALQGDVDVDHAGRVHHAVDMERMVRKYDLGITSTTTERLFDVWHIIDVLAIVPQGLWIEPADIAVMVLLVVKVAGHRRD